MRASNKCFSSLVKGSLVDTCCFGVGRCEVGNPFIYLSIDLSIYVSIYLPICLSIYLSIYLSINNEGSLEVKLPTMWTDIRHSQEEAEPGRNSDVEKVRREKIRDGEKSEERRCRCAKR